MQASGHAFTNIALAVVAENLTHVAGPAILLFQTSHIAPSLLTLKCVFYGGLFLTASLPDSDQRLGLKHRGITHSIIGLFLFTGGLLLAFWLATAFLSARFNVFWPEIQVFIRALLIALPLACAFHIIADAITIRGVRLLWPNRIHIRFLPKTWAIKNAHWTEYATVMLLLSLIGIGMALHVLGF